MERRLISSGSPYERRLGYSRAVRVGADVFVAGTAPIVLGGEPPEGAYAQAMRCFEIIAKALEDAGARLEHVVRVRVYLTRAEDFDEVGRAHAEVFADIRPVNTTVIAQLLDPRWLVEIDVQAVVT